MQTFPINFRAIRLLAILLTAASQLSAEEVDFSAKIQPLLARKCYACHGPDQQKSGLRFDDRRTLLAEADSGKAAVVPTKPDESELLKRVLSSDEDERMPPEGKPLTETEVALLREWVSQGAKYTAHWAFQPIQQPELPAVKNPTWLEQPIDAFVLAKIEAQGLKPVAPAKSADLIRRAYLDVTGLPPAPEVVEELTKNWTDQAYEQLIDKLLADPAFGERWARSWLDVVRFAESNSYERDNPKPNAWKYRDYVIDAFSKDKPYDQFISEQIAGDELEKVTRDSLVATGYFRLGIWDDEPADPAQAIFDEYDDLVTTTSQAFLALTLNCARCHDHKIDPLTQNDYYSLVALLRDVPSYGTRGDQQSANQLDLQPEIARQHEEIEAELKSISRRTRKIEQDAIQKMTAPDQRATEGPERKQVLREKLQQFVDETTWEEYQKLQQQQVELTQKKSELPERETTLGLGKCDPKPPATFVLLRGSPHSPAAEVPPAFPKLLGGGIPEVQVKEGARSAGRRRELAKWLTSDQNWLTSRVIVNRIWLHYFGRGIVRSPNNFGLMGETPSHPELLDYLATQLQRHAWSMKAVHRMILLSNTYRLSTETDSSALAKDPRNDLFWRQNIRRMSSEQLRDSVLAVSGQLNEQQGGESMYPTLSAEVLASQSRPGNGWGNSPPADQARRSIYIHVKRSLPVPMMSIFDFPDTDTSCEARFLTTQPGQALNLLNSDWMQQQSAALLQRIEREVGPKLESQVARALALVTSQEPDPQDVSDLLDLVNRLQTKFGLSEEDARQAVCLVVLNLNQFVYIN